MSSPSNPEAAAPSSRSPSAPPGRVILAVSVDYLSHRGGK